MAASLRGLLGLVLAGPFSGCGTLAGSMSGKSAALETYRRDAGPHADLGQARFLLDDFGSLDTHALQTNAGIWKVFATALLMSEAPRLGLPVARQSLPAVLEQFGFVQPDSIGNWDALRAPRPQLGEPLGLPRGMAHAKLLPAALELNNLNCAACHAGRTFDAQGFATRIAWLGLPNTSIDLEGYGTAVYAGLKRASRDEAGFLDTLQSIYTDISERERSTIRRQVMPRLRRRIQRIEAAGLFRSSMAGRVSAMESAH